MEHDQQKYESNFRAGLKAAVADTHKTQPEHSQATGNSMVAESGSRTAGNTQVDATSETTSAPSSKASTAPITEYEIGGKKFKTWDEAKVEVKRYENLDKLYGKQANELKQHRAQIEELTKSEVAEFVKQYKQHPDLQKEVLEAYKRWNAAKAGGATNKEASQISGIPPELAKEIADFKQFKSSLGEIAKKQQEFQQQQAEQHFMAQAAARIDEEEKELKTSFPNLDQETFVAVCKIAHRHRFAVDDEGKPAPMTLVQAKHWLDAQNAARKGPAPELPGEAGKTTTVRETPPGPKSLADVDDKGEPTGNGRKNIKALMRQYKKSEKDNK